MYKEVEMTGFMFFQHVLVIFKGGFFKKIICDCAIKQKTCKP